MGKNIVNIINMYRTQLAIAAILVVAVVAYYMFSGTQQAPQMDVKVVEVTKAHKGDIFASTSLIGEIRPRREAMFVAKESGVLDIIIDAGKTAKTGDLIAKIVNEEAEKQYSINKQNAQIAETQSSRANKLLQSGTLSKAGAEEKQSSMLSAQESLSGSKRALDNFRFYAPFDGVVGVFKYREGAQIKTGDQVVSFYDPSVILLNFDIPASFMENINDETEVSLNGKNYKLSHVQKLVDPNTRMAPAFAEVECDGCVLGSTTNIDLILNKKTDVILLPKEAVFVSNGKLAVYVIEEGKAALHNVETGIQDSKNIEVTSGVKEGDEVIAKGQTRLFPGVPVKILEENSADKEGK